MRKAVRPVWQIIIFVLGAAMLLLGVVLLVIPGPGLLVLLLGLLLLSTEFTWARRHRDNLKDHIQKIRHPKNADE